MISRMLDYALSSEELAELRAAHRSTRDKREADRIKAVILLGSGWPAEQVAEALMVDPNTVRSHFKRYRQGGLRALGEVAFCGSACQLDAEQLVYLVQHLNAHLYPTAKGIAAWVAQTFGVAYTESGMTALLHRLGFVYKKPKLVPGKADPEAQKAFLAEYAKLTESQGANDVIYFMDATHPQHNPVVGGGWIKRGQESAVRANSGRRRLNINGAIGLERLEPVVRFDPTIDADSTLALFQQLEQIHPAAARIHVICDNARYYHAKAVREYLQTSRIQLLFLPPYAPNLNLIERLWKFFKKTVLYNRYYETFSEFKAACEAFFKRPRQYRQELRSLLTENFAIIG